jgi:hypothetical protein
VGKVKKSGELTDVRRSTDSKRSSRKAARPKASRAPREAESVRQLKAAEPAERRKGPARPPTAAKTTVKATVKSAPRSPRKNAAAKKAVAKTVAAKKAAKRKASAPPPKRSRSGGSPRSAGKRKGRLSLVRGATGKSAKGRRSPPTREPVVQVRIRELDPIEKCGPGTSVERLIRVDEIIDRVLHAHLVFLDHHGWYCEHGQSCKAVGHARKHAQHVRSQFVGNGTHNGRMRA